MYNKDALKEKLDNLKMQQKQIEANWSKVQGAMEFCEGLLEEKADESVKSNGVAKKEKQNA